MLKQVYMQVDDGKFSRGRVYGVSKRVAKRLLRTHTQIEVMEGGRRRRRPGTLAVIATAEHLKPEKERAPVAEPLELVEMVRDVGRYAAGRTYGFSPALAKKYLEGYKSKGKVFPPVGIRPEPTEPAEREPFNPEGVKGISRRMVKELADLGYKSPEEIHTSRIAELTVVHGLGAATATRLKKLASEHAE